MKALTIVSVVSAAVLSGNVLAAQDVGIIKGRHGCPVGSQEVWIHMDNEDHNEASYVRDWVGAISRDSAGNIRYRFCRIPSSLLASAPGRFLVLQLGESCPAGKARVHRYFDNENSDNANSWGPSKEALEPNDAWSWHSTSLYFCSYTGGTGTFPNLGVEYGVFASDYGVPDAIARGEVFSDDEDNWPSVNENYYNWVAAGSTFWDGRSRYSPSVAYDAIGLEQNTSLRTAQVGVTAEPTRPVARCTSSPLYGYYRVDASFSDGGSYARGDRYLYTWEWSFSDGTTAIGKGPIKRVFYNYSGQSGSSRVYTGTLTVTDNAGESANATCSVTVYFR